MREPLLLPLVAVAGGILLGQSAGFQMMESAWPAAVLAGLAFVPVSWPVSPWLRRTALLLSLTFAGAFLVAAHRPTRMPVLNAGPRETVLAEGCVVEPTVFSDDRARFTLEVEPGARAQIQSYSVEVQPLRYGQRVEVAARFRSPRNFGNPGAFDYTAYLARRDVHWTAIIPSNGTVRLLPGECGSRWRAWIFALRTEAFNRIERMYPDNNYAAAMLEAVLIGETANLERVWTEDFRRSGTYHALVISGLHVSVLAALFLGLLRWVPLPRGAALLITAIAAWIYAGVAGFGIPVVRAAAGFSLYVVARMVFRRVRPLNLLAAIAIAYLAFDPLGLFEASFQLSFLSVAAIAAFAVPAIEKTTGVFAPGLRNLSSVAMDVHLEPKAAQLRVELRLAAETVELWTRLPARVVLPVLALGTRFVHFAFDLAVLSLAVQAGLSLPMAEYFHRISFTGLTANLLIVPLTNLLVPAGFLALLTGWSWATRLAQTLIEWSGAVAAWHAEREPSWRVPDPPAWLALALVAMLVAGTILVRRRRLRWPAVSAVAALLALLVLSPWAAALSPGEFEMTAIDVGQGDSVLLAFPRGGTMLIDGGGRLSYGSNRGENTKARSARFQTGLDTGEDVVSPYLWSRGIRRIDVIALTHAHQDHAGGIRALIENFHPSELWTGDNPPVELVSYARDLGVRVIQQTAGERGLFSGATVQVLAPISGRISGNPNNDSLVLRVAYGTHAFLLMGDLEQVEERHLLASGTGLAADVIKVGHHGSRTSSTQPFLDAVHPAIAVISAGYDNSFGHPHPDVLSRLAARHTTILRTDLGGLTTVLTDGRRLRYSQNSWMPPSRPLGLPVHLLH